MMDPDVIVVGAGPCGATAALRLARSGVRRVLLLDGAKFPRDKTCGSGLSPTAIALMDDLGLGAELRRSATPVESVRIVTPGGRSMVLSSDAAAMVLLRRDFDSMLVNEAVAAGATLEAGVRASRLLYSPSGRVTGVRLADGREIAARFVICADGAHSIFSTDERPKKSISTLMGWWDDADFTPGQLEMIFDRNVAPLYGWLFPESPRRINIGICIDTPPREERTLTVRDVFARFLEEHFAERLRGATQIGKFKGHPIVYSTFIGKCTRPGAVYAGEAARLTHNATGEGISQAMRSGLLAADAINDVYSGRRTEDAAFRAYVWNLRKRFTVGFLAGHLVRAAVDSSLLDGVAAIYGSPWVRKTVVRTLGSALAGTSVRDAAQG